MMKGRLKNGKERLDNALETLHLLCQPVASPKEEYDYQRYFCGNIEIAEEIKATEPQRSALYKGIVSLVRAYANIADEMEGAGYTSKERKDIEKEIDHYLKLREVIKQASGEKIDLKSYEADMRHLIDTYIQADESTVISQFQDMPLLDIIVNSGMDEAIKSMPNGISKNRGAVAETIVNNIRRKIIKDHLIDPAYFEKMSRLLDELIKERKAKAIEYEEFLERLAELAKNVQEGKDDETPDVLDTEAKRALYNVLNSNVALALSVDKAIKEAVRDNWRDNGPKEMLVKAAINQQLLTYEVDTGIDISQEPPEPYGMKNKVEAIFKIVVQQAEY